ncbi:hypothetical protein ACSBR1_010414 [Camellia fascicularis]
MVPRKMRMECLLGTMKLPLDTDIPRFESLLFQKRISVGGPCESVPIVAPCLSLWGEEEITEKEKREKELGGYGRGKVIYKERCRGMDLVVDRAQPDDLLVREVDTVVEHGLDFVDEGNSTKEDQINGEIVMEEAKEGQMNGAIVIEEWANTLLEKGALATELFATV